MSQVSTNNDAKFYTIDTAAKLSIDDSQNLKDVLDEVEQRTTKWIKNNNWQHYKTVKNQTNPTDNIDQFNTITVHKSTDINFSKKYSIWKVEAYVPEKDSIRILSYYNKPQIRTQFDNAMSKFYELPIKQINVNDDQKIDPLKSDKSDNNSITDINMMLNVCFTKPAVKGWVSSRLFVNIVGNKFSNITNEYCTVSTYLPDTMLENNKYKQLLSLTDNDISTNILGRNISLYFGAKRIVNTNYSKVTYLLQSNNGGWIPQWAVELGMVEQHMISIFKKMTQWLLINKNNNNNHINPYLDMTLMNNLKQFSLKNNKKYIDAHSNDT